MASDQIGDRMKRQYEDRTRIMLPRRSYTILRCDGKAFHTFTRRCEKPYDYALAAAMSEAACDLCGQAQGAAFGYIQSDEISVLLTDFQSVSTAAWFDGNLQKLVSVAASIVTARFNAHFGSHTALFDCRAFTIPDPIEVENYFIWRQQDATRNSIQGLAQSHFTHKRLEGLNTSQLQDLLQQEKGINWNDLPADQKRGRCALYTQSDTLMRGPDDEHVWGSWNIDHEPPIFTADRMYLIRRIPQYEIRLCPQVNA